MWDEGLQGQGHTDGQGKTKSSGSQALAKKCMCMIPSVCKSEKC